MPPSPSAIDSVRGRFEAFLDAVDAGAEYRRAWEDLLADVPRRDAVRLEWGTRESVGAAALTAPAEASARTLILGSALLGTAPALAAVGAEVCVADDSTPRLRFAAARARAHGFALRAVDVAGASRLPFEDGSFGRVVLPDAPHSLPRADGESGAAAWRRWLGECARVLRDGGSMIVLCDNRLAYKKFGGTHGRYTRAALRRFFSAGPSSEAADGEGTLRSYPESLRRAGFRVTGRYAAYVSHLDYSMLANLDVRRPPFLEVGRRERKNWIKTAAFRAGLFPWLVPSFAWVAVRGGGDAPPPLLQRAAEHAGRAFGASGAAVVERAVATRGNALLAFVTYGGAGSPRLVVRIPLCEKEQRLGGRHLDVVRDLRARFPGLRVPRAFGVERFEGFSLYVEEYLPGENSSQQTGELGLRAATLRDLADQLAMIAPEPTLIDDTILKRIIFDRAERIAARLRDDDLRMRVGALARRAAALLRGKRVPLPTSHGDLRAKHCLVDGAGRLTGLLDWGTARAENLPLFDLLHFVLHDRKQEWDDPLDAAALKALHPRRFRPHEEAAFADYCRRLGLDDDARLACELHYPLEVAATAYDNWDYDRPRWVEENFGELLRRTAAPD